MNVLKNRKEHHFTEQGMKIPLRVRTVEHRFLSQTLCLRSYSNENEPCGKTMCCLTSVHTSCVNDIIYISEQLESIYIECAACGCIWTHADMGEAWYINLDESESDSN